MFQIHFRVQSPRSQIAFKRRFSLGPPIVSLLGRGKKDVAPWRQRKTRQDPHPPLPHPNAGLPARMCPHLRQNSSRDTSAKKQNPLQQTLQTLPKQQCQKGSEEEVIRYYCFEKRIPGAERGRQNTSFLLVSGHCWGAFFTTGESFLPKNVIFVKAIRQTRRRGLRQPWHPTRDRTELQSPLHLAIPTRGAVTVSNKIFYRIVQCLKPSFQTARLQSGRRRSRMQETERLLHQACLRPQLWPKSLPRVTIRWPRHLHPVSTSR